VLATVEGPSGVGLVHSIDSLSKEVMRGLCESAECVWRLLLSARE
jgi:hypothetical protein